MRETVEARLHAIRGVIACGAYRVTNCLTRFQWVVGLFRRAQRQVLSWYLRSGQVFGNVASGWGTEGDPDPAGGLDDTGADLDQPHSQSDKLRAGEQLRHWDRVA